MTKKSYARRNCRLDDLISDLIERSGDNCGICGAPFTDRARTFCGVRFSTLSTACDCCVTKLDPVLATGIYKKSGAAK